MPETEAEAIADLARKQTVAHVVSSRDGHEYLIVPGGMNKYEVNDEHGLKRTMPWYLQQSVTLQAVESLIEYVNRYKVTDTILFADIAANSICAVLDFHPASKTVVKDASASPIGRAANRATMTLPFSQEWSIWSGVSGHLKSQLDFARFVEENGGDITAPSGGDVLDAMRDLQANRKVNFIKAVRTASENENFEYTDETEMKHRGGIEVPTKFKLAIPVYFGEPATELFAFLRWKLDDGKLHLGVQLHRAEHVRQAVFKQIVLSVSESTTCPVVFGKPSG